MLDIGNLFLFGIYVLAFFTLAFIVTAEVAFLHVREDRLEKLVQRRVPGARRLAQLQTSHDSLAFAIAILRSVANAVLAIAGFILMVRLVQNPYISIPAGLLLAVGGGIIAQGAGRVWGRIDPEKIALTLVPLGILVEGFLAPVTRLTFMLHRPLIRRLARKRPSSGNGNAPEQAQSGGGTDGNALEDSPDTSQEEIWERQVIRGVIGLASTTVREIMVPRPDIVAIPDTVSLDEAVEVVLRKGYSRVPVYHETIDTIVGILYAKDLLAALRNGLPINLTDLVRPALLVPEMKRLDGLLREFQEKRIQIALVVDEYGSIAGLVTNEDLLEEMVGDIEDEFAIHEPQVERLSENEAIVDARMALGDVNDLFGIDLQADGFDTLGGLIYHQIGRIPMPGETIQQDGVQLAVLSTVGRRIKRVRITRIPAKVKAEDG